MIASSFDVWDWCDVLYLFLLCAYKCHVGQNFHPLQLNAHQPPSVAGNPFWIVPSMVIQKPRCCLLFYLSINQVFLLLANLQVLCSNGHKKSTSRSLPFFDKKTQRRIPEGISPGIPQTHRNERNFPHTLINCCLRVWDMFQACPLCFSTWGSAMRMILFLKGRKRMCPCIIRWSL